MIENGAFYIKK